MICQHLSSPRCSLVSRGLFGRRIRSQRPFRAEVGDLGRWLEKGKAAMQTKSVSMMCSLLLVLGCACACRPTSQPSASLTSADHPDDLCQDATETYLAYVQAFEPGTETDVPSNHWSRGIRALQPVRVYLHRANVVVVQQVSGEIERGKYIQGPVSSYFPKTGDDGFEFSTSSGAGYGVSEFKRSKHL